MSFNPSPPLAEYTATAGQTVFPFVFKIYQASDIEVYLTLSGDTPNDDDDILTLTTDYTITIDGDEGGVITLVSGAAIGDSVTLIRNLPTTRNVEFQQNGDLLASTLNEDQDYQAYLISDNALQLTKVLKFPISAQGLDGTLPGPSPENYIRWNSAGDALENDLTAPGFVTETEAFKDEAEGYKNDASQSAIDATTNGAIQVGLAEDQVTLATTQVGLAEDQVVLATAQTGLATTQANRAEDEADRAELYAGALDPANILFKDNTDEFIPIGDYNPATKKYVDDSSSFEPPPILIVSSWSYVTNIMTANISTPHNLEGGDTFLIDGLVASTNSPNGTFQVATVVDDYTITYTSLLTPTGTPTVSSATLVKTVVITSLHVTDDFDLGQSWVDVTSERSAGVEYINDTGMTIEVSISYYVSTTSSDVFIADGVAIQRVDSFSLNKWFKIGAVVHPGETYELSSSGGLAGFYWFEEGQ